MLALVVSVQVRPGHREPFLAAIEENAERSVADEAGCSYFDVSVDTTDDHHFVFYELYRDRAAVDAHRDAPHYADWQAASDEHLVPGSKQVTTTEVLSHNA